MPALTEFQLKKVKSVYQNLYDSNKDGIIDKNDFKDCMKKISSLHHWANNDDAYRLAKDILENVWEGLQKDADINEDGIVTLDEWVKMWNKFSESGKVPQWNEEYIKFMFLANDTSGDGFVDRGEFVTVQKIFGNSEADSNKAFDKLAQGAKEDRLSKEDFTSLWHEYFTSNNAEARGNYLFGLPPK